MKAGQGGVNRVGLGMIWSLMAWYKSDFTHAETSDTGSVTWCTSLSWCLPSVRWAFFQQSSWLAAGDLIVQIFKNIT